MTAPRALIFDFDGTLADSYGAITASVNHVRAHHGLPALLEAEVRRHVGHGVTHLLEHLVPGADLVADVARYRAHHPSVLRTGTRLLPGVGPTLNALNERGMLLAVCSNKPRVFTQPLLDFLGLTPLLGTVLGPEDVLRLKPAPDMLQEALRQLHVLPAEAVYVGDMVVDIETARAAGVPVWVVATGSDDAARLQGAGPDRFLESFAEIATVLAADV